jgi:HPt (histidine-containing phosphotransfer) domain-containing protein
MPSEPAPADSLCQVDANVVAELSRVSGSAHLYSRLVELFRRGSSEALTELRSALATEAFQAARAVCHKLKSSAANVGALAFSRQLALLEQRCAEADGTRARELFGVLQAAHAGLLAELGRFRG